MADQRFLIVRLGSLGDIVHTFPAVAALRQTFPSAEIVWLTHPRWQYLVESSSVASAVWTVEPRAVGSLGSVISRIRATSWDAAIDYQGLWKSATLPFLGGVKRRIGFDSGSVREYGAHLLYTDRVQASAKHIADQNGELSLRAGAGNPVADVTLRISPQDDEAVRAYLQNSGIRRYIVLSPGGGWRSKCWPSDRYGAVCVQIWESLAIRCVVNYGPGEQDLPSEVRTSSGAASAPLGYNGTLGQLMALLRNAACVVGGDTGPLHLAAALGTPVVALFGPTDPARNGPYRVTHASGDAAGDDIVLRAPNIITTHSREDLTHPAMLALQVDDVVDAIIRRIGATR
jgi:heptosyltransferase-1